MPAFKYKAVNKTNKIETGRISANNQKEAAETLGKKGLKPISVQKDVKSKTATGKIPPIEKINFVRHMSTMLGSGISLTEGMTILQEETKHPVMKKLLSDISYSLDQGQQLSSVFARYPEIFNKVFITLTRAGEVSGGLSETFKYLEEELRADYELSQKIKGAMMYPAIVFIAMLAIAILMFFFILPQIAKVFLSMKIPLPAFTQFLFQTSMTASKYTLPLIAATIVFIATAFIFLKSDKGKQSILGLISPLPFIKSILKQVDLARFTRIFSTLVKSAVPITEALDISLSTMSYRKFQGLNKRIGDQIKQGKNLSTAFKTIDGFPVILTQMIAAGEKSGSLDNNLQDLSKYYAQEVEESVKKATTLLEPMLMLVVGVGVGGIILSIISPLYSVVGNLQGVN
ncbi:type II secretion system F family protein [Patescibacteria group bacterium]